MPGNAHSCGVVLLIVKQQRTGRGVIDPFLTACDSLLKCKTVFANIMIESAVTTIIFCTESLAEFSAEFSHIFKMLSQGLSFRVFFGWTMS